MTNRKTIDNYVQSINMSFGRQLKEKRCNMGLSRMELAEKSSVSLRWIYYVELGTKSPSLYTISALSMALDFYEWDFFTLKRF